MQRLHYWMTAFIVFLLALNSSFAADGIDILENTILVSGTTGTATGSFTVNNTGTNTYDVTFGASVLTDENGNTLFIDLPTDIPSLDPGEQQASSVLVDVTGAVTGIYNGTLTAIGGTALDTAVIQTTVLSNGLGVTKASAGTPANTTDPGMTIQNQVQIRNNRNEALNVTVNGSIFNTTFLNQQITLSAFALSTLPYSITVPSNQAVGIYTGSLFLSWDNGNLAIPIELTVNPRLALTTPTAVSVTADLGDTVLTTFTIVNTGNDEAIVNISLNQSDFTDDDGDRINVTPNKAQNVVVSPGETEVVTLTIDVPARADPQSYTGMVHITGAGIDRSFPLTITVRNVLEITDIEVDSPDSERRLKPGEVFEVRVEVENIAAEIDLEEVNVRVAFLDGTKFVRDDDGDTLEEDVDLNDLSAGEDDEITFTFRTPFDVDDGDRFVVFVEVTARNKDDRSQLFNVTKTGDSLTIDREEHDVELFLARLDTGVLACNRQTSLEIGARNVGQDEEDVELTITNRALGISYADSFVLSDDEDDNNFEIIRRFPVDAQGAEPGQYLIALAVQFDNGRDAVQATVPLTVAPCGQVSEEPTGTIREPVIVQYDQGTQVPPSPFFSARKLGKDFNWLIWLLILGNVVVALLLILGYKRYRQVNK